MGRIQAPGGEPGAVELPQFGPSARLNNPDHIMWAKGQGQAERESVGRNAMARRCSVEVVHGGALKGNGKVLSMSRGLSISAERRMSGRLKGGQLTAQLVKGGG